MMKRIMKKLKDLTLSITFAKPDEYESTKKHTKRSLDTKKKQKQKKRLKQKKRR